MSVYVPLYNASSYNYVLMSMNYITIDIFLTSNTLLSYLWHRRYNFNLSSVNLKRISMTLEIKKISLKEAYIYFGEI